MHHPIIQPYYKSKFYKKPNESDYNTAFKHLADYYKILGFKKLLFFPMGCLQDQIDISHFIMNLSNFQNIPYRVSDIYVVVYKEPHVRTLKSSMTHQDFLINLEH